MPTYTVTNRITKETQRVNAACAQDACRLLGWVIDNCHVKMEAWGLTWNRVPDVIEEDGQRLGPIYEQEDLALLRSEEIYLLREEQARAEEES